MLFSSLTFLFLFLPLFFLTYFIVKGRKGRNLVLFLFSLVFYAWGEPLYLFLMLFSLSLNYLFAILIDKQKGKGKKAFLVGAVAANLLLLGVYKYAAFAVGTVNGIFGTALPLPQIALPIGISFYTFQILSYVVDVYRGEVKCQYNLVFLGSYLAAFPQLIAGPIVRYETVEEELTERSENLTDITNGVRRFLFGLAKKVLIANTMASVCDKLLENTPVELGAAGAWIAIVSYALQIYFDFSGYSDMAIGLGAMMGFHYLENFNYPYIASSITDFWRRWHISLSTFFRDYVYIPLGGNRVSKPRWVFNMGVVWLLTGLWHGASWNFVLWGVYFFLLLTFEKLVVSKIKWKPRVANHVITLLLILLGWVLFRSETLSYAGQWAAAMFGGYGLLGLDASTLPVLLQKSEVNTVYLITLVFGIVLSTPIAKKLTAPTLGEKPTVIGIVRDVLALALFLLCIITLASGAYNPFIYFRF